jgi:aspartate ammonia-lyase
VRIERDSLGELEIPDDAYYGIHTFRAVQNFPISGTLAHPELIRTYLLLKRCAARANARAKVLDQKRCAAIVAAIDLLLTKGFRQHFVVDAYQAGAGTSVNMNTNEVVANAANKGLGKPLGSYHPIHPNDHVNMSQSSNDTYPTVMRLSVLSLSHALVAELESFRASLALKATEFDPVLKSARTHLQDAVPIRLGQEFGAYAETVGQLIQLIRHAQGYLRELGIGGSAAGTGVNVPKGFRRAILKELKDVTGDPELRLAPNMCAAMQSQLPMTVYSSALRAIALELTRVFNDLRLLSSGPANGLGEILLPSTQAGSSIMPGKVNPSMLEMANQVCFRVLGNDTAIAFSAQAGQLELNVMTPVMAHSAIEATELLTNMLRTVRLRCIDGIVANKARCQQFAEQTSQMATALNPVLGYAKAGEIAKEAVQTGQSVVEVVRARGLLTENQIKKILDPFKLTEPAS